MGKDPWISERGVIAIVIGQGSPKLLPFLLIVQAKSPSLSSGERYTKLLTYT